MSDTATLVVQVVVATVLGVPCVLAWFDWYSGRKREKRDPLRDLSDRLETLEDMCGALDLALQTQDRSIQSLTDRLPKSEAVIRAAEPSKHATGDDLKPVQSMARAVETPAPWNVELARKLFREWCEFKRVPSAKGISCRSLRMVVEPDRLGGVSPLEESDRLSDFALLSQDTGSNGYLFPNPDCRFSPLLAKYFPELREGWETNAYTSIRPWDIRRDPQGLWRVVSK